MCNSLGQGGTERGTRRTSPRTARLRYREPGHRELGQRELGRWELGPRGHWEPRGRRELRGYRRLVPRRLVPRGLRRRAVGLCAVLLLLTAAVVSAQEAGLRLEQAKRAQTPACPAYSLERFAQVFFTVPTWESIPAGDGTTAVHVHGPLARHNNKLVVARISYALDASGRLSFRAMDITGIAQPAQTYVILTKKVCPTP